MPDGTTITNEQRDGLYELVRNHLGAIGDVWIALEEDEDYATAERLGLEFAEDFRLLADIGWAPQESRGSIRLTMPDHELRPLLGRLRAEAEALLAESADERRSREEDEQTEARHRLGLEACEELLAGLDVRGEE